MKLTTHCYAALLLASFGFYGAKAQTAYSMHTLEKGETLSMLAKTYHTTVGDIMRLNGMNAQSHLVLGEKIKIPAGGTVVAEKQPATVASQPVAASTSTPAVAKTHTVATGETLYRISKMYNTTVEKLQAWNQLGDGGVKLGQTLIVSEGTPPTTPAKARPEPTETPTNNIGQTNQPALTQTPQKEVSNPAPVAKQQPQTTTPAATSVTQNELPKSTTSTSQMTSTTPPATNVAPDNTNYAANDMAVNNAPKEGFFMPQYGKEPGRHSEEVKTGTAMTFKSASGWADKKYYILMNDAPTGSIVKIKSGKNELYAKVLWNLGEMKENDGLAFRISTATAAALDITDQKFDLRVSYYE